MKNGLHSLNSQLLSSYVNNFKSIPTLSKDEEFILTKNFKEKNDLIAIKKLIESNLTYIIKIARKYQGYGIVIKDLVQEGVVGFIKSVKNFDSSKNIRLISFAIYWVKSEIHAYIIKNLSIVKIANTRSQKKLFFNLKKIKNIDWLNNDEYKVISNLFNIHPNDIQYMELRLKKSDMSLDFKSDDKDFYSNFFSCSLENDTSFIVENENWNNYLLDRLKESIKKLDERSKSILKERWLLNRKSTLKDLSEKYNISSERIRQLENNAIKKVKKLMNLEHL